MAEPQESPQKLQVTPHQPCFAAMQPSAYEWSINTCAHMSAHVHASVRTCLHAAPPHTHGIAHTAAASSDLTAIFHRAARRANRIGRVGLPGLGLLRRTLVRHRPQVVPGGGQLLQRPPCLDGPLRQEQHLVGRLEVLQLVGRHQHRRPAGHGPLVVAVFFWQWTGGELGPPPRNTETCQVGSADPDNFLC